MRPMYETQEQITNEEKVRLFLEERMKGKLHKLPISYRLDWILFKDGKAKAVVEYKRRKCSMNQYPDIMLSLGKWNAGLDYKIKNGMKFVFVVQFTDGFAMYIHDDKHEADIRWGGRTAQTRDSADIEPVVHIPITRFVKF